MEKVMAEKTAFTKRVVSTFLYYCGFINPNEWNHRWSKQPILKDTALKWFLRDQQFSLVWDFYLEPFAPVYQCEWYRRFQFKSVGISTCCGVERFNHFVWLPCNDYLHWRLIIQSHNSRICWWTTGFAILQQKFFQLCMPLMTADQCLQPSGCLVMLW